MRWLKSLVIVLAALIALALGLLGYGFLKKSADPGWRLLGSTTMTTPAVSDLAPAGKPIQSTPPATPARTWGEINLSLGAECKVDGVQTEGDRLYLTIGPAGMPGGTCHRVVVIDTTRGRVLGTVRPSQ